MHHQRQRENQRKQSVKHDSTAVRVRLRLRLRSISFPSPGLLGEYNRRCCREVAVGEGEHVVESGDSSVDIRNLDGLFPWGQTRFDLDLGFELRDFIAELDLNSDGLAFALVVILASNGWHHNRNSEVHWMLRHPLFFRDQSI